MDTIIFATGNKNKMIEIRMILADLGCKILSQKEAGIQADVVEDGQTFEENALIKATTIADIARKMPEYKNAVVLADDSGLEIDALNKEPGIYSARYMGEDTSYDIKNQALIDRLEGVPDEKRTARFVCAIAAALQTEVRKLYEERWKVVLVMRSQGKMDSDMIRSFICRSLAAAVRNLNRRRKMN